MDSVKVVIRPAINGYVVEYNYPWVDRVEGDPPRKEDELYVYKNLRDAFIAIEAFLIENAE